MSPAADRASEARTNRSTHRVPEQQVARLAFGGGINLVGALVSQGSLFGVTLILARVLGTAEVGVYSQAFAIRALLQLACLGGMRSALTRYVALFRVDKDDAAVKGTVYFGLGFSLAIAILTAAALFLVAPILADHVFRDEDLTEPLYYVALSLPASVVTVAALSATQGFLTMRPFSLIGLIVEPAVRLLLTIGLLALGFGLRGAMVALLFAGLLAAILATLWLRKLLGPVKAARPRFAIREIGRFAAVSWIASLATQGLLWVDIVILGVLVSSADVGVYQVATRLVVVAALAVNPLNSSFAPRAADLWRRGERELLGRSYSAIVSWMLRISLPAFVALVVFPRELLEMFGDDFGAGVAVVLIFTIGELVDVGTSSAAILLNMAGKNLLNMVDSVAVLGMNIGLNVMLVPIWGIAGSATAWSLALVTIGVLRVLQARAVVLGALPYGWPSARGVVAAVAALGVAFFVRSLASTPLAVLGGLVAIVVTYLTVLIALGISDDDWAVLGAVKARFHT